MDNESKQEPISDKNEELRNKILIAVIVVLLLIAALNEKFDVLDKVKNAFNSIFQTIFENSCIILIINENKLLHWQNFAQFIQHMGMVTIFPRPQNLRAGIMFHGF